jgi:hypothetical protein
MMSGNFSNPLLKSDLSGEDAGLDGQVGLTWFESFKALAGFALDKAAFQLFLFVRSQHWVPPACLYFTIETA